MASSSHMFVECVLLHHLCGDSSNGQQSVDVGEARFQQALKQAQQALRQPGTSRRVKVYVHNNLHMEVDTSTCESRVHELSPRSCTLHAHQQQQPLACLVHERTKVPVHTFPCTRTFHQVYTSEATVLRDPRQQVQVVFEVQQHVSGRRVHRVSVQCPKVPQDAGLPQVLAGMKRAISALGAAAPTC